MRYCITTHAYTHKVIVRLEDPADPVVYNNYTSRREPLSLINSHIDATRHGRRQSAEGSARSATSSRQFFFPTLVPTTDDKTGSAPERFYHPDASKGTSIENCNNCTCPSTCAHSATTEGGWGAARAASEHRGRRATRHSCRVQDREDHPGGDDPSGTRCVRPGGGRKGAEPARRGRARVGKARC